MLGGEACCVVGYQLPCSHSGCKKKDKSRMVVEETVEEGSQMQRRKGLADTPSGRKRSKNRVDSGSGYTRKEPITTTTSGMTARFSQQRALSLARHRPTEKKGGEAKM